MKIVKKSNSSVLLKIALFPNRHWVLRQDYPISSKPQYLRWEDRLQHNVRTHIKYVIYKALTIVDSYIPTESSLWTGYFPYYHHLKCVSWVLKMSLIKKRLEWSENKDRYYFSNIWKPRWKQTKHAVLDILKRRKVGDEIWKHPSIMHERTSMSSTYLVHSKAGRGRRIV